MFLGRLPSCYGLNATILKGVKIHFLKKSLVLNVFAPLSASFLLHTYLRIYIVQFSCRHLEHTEHCIQSITEVVLKSFLTFCSSSLLIFHCQLSKMFTRIRMERSFFIPLSFICCLYIILTFSKFLLWCGIVFINFVYSYSSTVTFLLFAILSAHASIMALIWHLLLGLESGIRGKRLSSWRYLVGVACGDCWYKSSYCSTMSNSKTTLIIFSV